MTEPLDFDLEVRSTSDWPIPGVEFKDWNPLLATPGRIAEVSRLLEEAAIEDINIVVGAEARGFVFGPMLASFLDSGFVPLRKPGKTPPKVHSHSYKLEYGEDTIEMAADLIQPGDRVLFHDDLLATGGTAAAAVDLIRSVGGEPVQALFVFELQGLPGRRLLEDRGLPVAALHLFK